MRATVEFAAGSPQFAALNDKDDCHVARLEMRHRHWVPVRVVSARAVVAALIKARTRAKKGATSHFDLRHYYQM